MKKILLILVLSLLIFNSCNKDDGNPVTPTTPTVPTLSSPSDGAADVPFPITLTWNAFAGAASYTLQVSGDSAFTSFVYNQSGLTSTTQQMSGLSDSTKYYWRVSSDNSSGPSNTWSFKTASSGGSAPGVPTLLSPNNGVTDQPLTLALSWNFSSGATSYNLQISDSSIFTNILYDTSGITGTSHNVSGLSYQTSHYWRVSGTNNNGSSNWSGVWMFRTINAPAGITTLSSPGNGATNVPLPVTFVWNATNGATSYTLQVSESSAFASYVYNQTGLTSTSRQVTGLSDTTTYYWRVSSDNSSGPSNTWSFKTASTGGTVPDPPLLLAPVNNSNNQPVSLTLSWNASSGAASYNLQVSTSNSFTTIFYNQSGIAGTSRQISGLSNNTKYYWRVSGTNNNGSSNWSSVWSFTTAGLPPAVPTLISPGDGGTDVPFPVTFSWNASTGAQDYTLQVSTSVTFTNIFYNQSGITGTNRQVSGLSATTTYYWRVIATNTFGSSNPSPTWSFTTNDGKPGVPTLLSPSDGAASNYTSPTLTWNASVGATSYTLQVSESNLFTSYVYNQGGLTGTSKKVNGLSDLTTYYWRVSASNTMGTSNPSNSWSFTTNDGRPSVPTLLSPSDGAAKQSLSPTLKWNVSSGATSYTLQVSESNTFTSYVYNQSGLTSTSQQVSGLSNSTTYYWRVSASNSYGISNPSNPWSFTTFGGSSCVGTPTITYSGKTYNTVQVGSQCWLKENLDVGVYVISTGSGSTHSDVTNNGIIEKYCYWNHEPTCATYGGLYDWNESMGYITTAGAQGICPPGWHIPTYGEFEALKATLSNDGNALKSVGQGTGAGAGTNTSGFSALLGGSRRDDGFFQDLVGIYSYFWSSTETSSHYVGSLYLIYNDSYISLPLEYKENGYSIRCVKD